MTNKMTVIVKYEIKSYDCLEYGMFQSMDNMIPNLLIEGEKEPLGGVCSNVSWLHRDVHMSTNEIKKRFGVEEVDYVLFELPMNQW